MTGGPKMSFVLFERISFKCFSFFNYFSAVKLASVIARLTDSVALAIACATYLHFSFFSTFSFCLFTYFQYSYQKNTTRLTLGRMSSGI